MSSSAESSPSSPSSPFAAARAVSDPVCCRRLKALIEHLQRLLEVHGNVQLADWGEAAIGQNLTVEVQSLMAMEDGTFQESFKGELTETVIVLGGLGSRAGRLFVAERRDPPKAYTVVDGARRKAFCASG